MSKTEHYAKRWCLTLNNYTEADIRTFKRELGENGTPHLQGFLHFKKRYRMHQIKAMLSRRMHLEMARGTDEQNDKYCGKEEDVILRVGSPKRQKQKTKKTKKRTDLEKSCAYQNVLACAEKLSDGHDLSEIFENYDTGNAYLRHPKVVKELNEARRKQKEREKALEKLGDPVLQNGRKNSSEK